MIGWFESNDFRTYIGKLESMFLEVIEETKGKELLNECC